MPTPSGLPTKQEFIDGQLDVAHLGRVVNSKDAQGNPITTSTNRTGGVNKTLDALETEYTEAIRNAGGQPLGGGTWQAGQTFTAYNQFMVYNGIAYKPLTTTTLPYGPTGATPDLAFVGPFSDVTDADITIAQGELIGGVVFPPSGDLAVGMTVPIGTTHLRVDGAIYAMGQAVNGTVSNIGDNSAIIGGAFISLSPSCAGQYRLKSTPPAVPPASSNIKIIMRPQIDGDDTYGVYVVSRKSRSKKGYVATRISKEVATADSLNVGGDSNFRPTSVINILDCYVACCRKVDASGQVALSGLPEATIDSFWDYSNSGVAFDIHAESEAQEINAFNREAYQVPKNLNPSFDEYVEFEVSGDCSVRLGLTSSSTPSCKIDVGVVGSMYHYRTVSLVKTPSTPLTYLDVKIEAPTARTPYRVRVSNSHKGDNGNNCYVVGLNVGKLNDFSSHVDITTALIQQPQAYGGAANMYRRSTGANEFAAKETGGKFFGTFHGGHSGFLERLRVDSGANYDLRDIASVPKLMISEHITLHSQSVLTPDSGSGSYNYVAETFFYDGFDYTQYSITLRSGNPAIVSDAYTHMCTTNNTFNRIYQPVLHTYTANEEVMYGNEQSCYQYRDDGLSIVSYYSGVDMVYNTNRGGRVSYQSSFAKQYYGPVLGFNVPLVGGMFVTAKEYF